jgi:hypothetical protein
MESGNVSGSSQVWTGRPVGSNQGRMLPAKTEIFPLQTETYLHQWRGKTYTSLLGADQGNIAKGLTKAERSVNKNRYLYTSRIATW